MTQKSAAWSRHVWLAVVWPAVADQFPDYHYCPIEDLPQNLARNLDANGGTDAFLLCNGRNPIGLAQRAQVVKPGARPYNTFTIRVRKPSGLPTEIHKHWAAKLDPIAYTAGLTGQAYLSIDDVLLTAGLAATTEITAVVPKRSRPLKINPADDVGFTYVDWREVPLRAVFPYQQRLFA